MKATLTSKGQITIPRAIRERLHLHAGDVLDFDENSTILLARRVVDPEQWDAGLEYARRSWNGHVIPEGHSGKSLLEELRGPVEVPPEKGNHE